MELVAHEPDVTDPMAACFDANGGMYVAEMIDYPYRPKDGAKPLGRVRYLQDTDDDGRYDRSWIFADSLVWPTGVVCWKGGVYVAAAPDIWYLKDEDGDHRADVRTKIYTGFGDRNQQGGVNNLNWHIDHTIYGSASTNGGEILPADNPGGSRIVLSDRDFRFDPVSHRFETVSGSRQFGNAFDDWFNRFLCSESKPAYHVVLSQRYVGRNPHLAVPTAVNDLAPGVTPIFRTSPIERWRQVRSGRRLAVGERGADSAGLSHNVIDAAGGLAIYRGHAYPDKYRGNLLIGCSQNNLIHRRQLTPAGATFLSRRADEQTEFVRTTDTWFRPVNCIAAPEGTLYVLDMSREVIESIHIAHDVVAHLDLTSGRDRGRIYRLAPPGFKPLPQPRLAEATTAELVGHLEHPGGWWRDTASRLIYERQDRSVVELLRRRLAAAPSGVGRLHILWALDGLAALDQNDLAAALADESPGVREHAVRLAESRLAKHPAVVEKILALADDPAPRVRFQVAYTLGEIEDPRAIGALARIAAHDCDEPWIRTAVLSSCATRADRLAVALLADDTFLTQPAAANWLSALATIVGAGKQDAELSRILDAAAAMPNDSPWPTTIVHGVGAGLQRAGASLRDVPGGSAGGAALVERLLAAAARTATDAGALRAARTGAIGLLGYSGSPEVVEMLRALVASSEAPTVQLAALRVLARHTDPSIAQRLVEVCGGASAKAQAEILTVLGSRPAWAAQLLAACLRGEVTAGLIPQATQAALLRSDDARLREQAEKLFGGARPRAEVIARYQPATARHGNPLRGDKVYQQQCMACHRVGKRGQEVGPNLALIRNRTRQALVEAILDPNRIVAPNYVSYIVVDDSGRTTTGMILSETAASITLARDKGETETIQKQNIEQIKSSGASLMPEGLEKTIDPEAMADLLAFLEAVQYDIGTLPDFVAPE
jgi:putative membrane-bound dehydrogenase-like protein